MYANHLQKKSNIFFLLSVYIFIVVGDPLSRRVDWFYGV